MPQPSIDTLESFDAPSGSICENHDPKTGEMCGDAADHAFVVEYKDNKSLITTCDDHGSRFDDAN